MKAETKRYEQARANEETARAELERARELFNRYAGKVSILDARLTAYCVESNECKAALMRAASRA